ncbi:MAG: hypothetical protein H7Y36_00540 [Armatimonadetes bacterium]|nr:hypothetical protein [Akkermansiaceae bacterium]
MDHANVSPPPHDASPALVNSLPTPPRLTLRVGFAGNQHLPADSSLVAAALGQVFETLATRLVEIAPGTPVQASTPEPRIHQYYSAENPVLRLITGLCQGADSLAADVLEKLASHEKFSPHLLTELAAVIPFEFPVYRSSRPPGFLEAFDAQAARCTYILTLDGIYEKPNPDTKLANDRRKRAYRAQSTLLLRQADIIIAAADPDAEGSAGGTLETLRAALEFDLPVIFVHTLSGRITLIEPGDDPASAIATLADGKSDWQKILRLWVTTIVADPDVDLAEEHASGHSSEHETEASHGEKLLKEFFHASTIPPLITGNDGKPTAKTSRSARLWTRFENSFRSGPVPKSDPPLQPYKLWRDRSTRLNYHYTGLYRGAFFLNYLLATVAVTLAALSLVLLGFLPSHPEKAHGAVEHHPVIEKLSESPFHHASFPIYLTLLVLGAIKLACVWTIFRTTHRANHGDWNDKAVDYRYLAERLRTMYYLPLVGSFQPPVAAPPQYASRVVRQSAADWLLDAIIRSVSPASLPDLRQEKFQFENSSYQAAILPLQPVTLLTAVRDSWLKQQAIYHDRNSRTMDRIHTWAENWGKILNFTVIGFVLVDLGFVTIDILLPDKFPVLHSITPWLIFAAAVLPAAVGSLNGIRFQSECRRLAERSAIMRAILAGRTPKPSRPPEPTRGEKIANLLIHRPLAFLRTLLPFAAKIRTPAPLEPHGSKLAAAERLLTTITSSQASPSTDLASWTPEVLRFSESVASTFVHEVSEWSVLYAKEVPEP